MGPWAGECKWYQSCLADCWIVFHWGEIGSFHGGETSDDVYFEWVSHFISKDQRLFCISFYQYLILRMSFGLQISIYTQ